MHRLERVGQPVEAAVERGDLARERRHAAVHAADVGADPVEAIVDGVEVMLEGRDVCAHPDELAVHRLDALGEAREVLERSGEEVDDVAGDRHDDPRRPRDGSRTPEDRVAHEGGARGARGPRFGGPGTGWLGRPHDAPDTTLRDRMAAPDPTPPQGEEARDARRALRARLASGPLLGAVAKVDVRVYRAIRQTARPNALHDVVHGYSALGEHAALWLALGAGGALLDGPVRRPRWRRATTSVLAAYLLNVALKNVFRRRRPSQEDLPHLTMTPTGLSFPSAHASSSFAAARAYSGLLPAPALYAAASAMALSRVYLGVHYPTDIAVGATVGTIVGSAGQTP